MEMPPIQEGIEETTEMADPLNEEEQGAKIQEFLKLEQEIKDRIAQETEPIAKENMEWELRIIHSANTKFFAYGDTYSYFHTPTLPLPLLKLESEACAKKLRPDVLDDELGGWEEIDVQDWRRPAVMQNQPGWQISWFRKHPDTIVAYAQAPRDLRINPVFCPCIRRRNWPAFKRFNQMRPNYLNYPLMPSPPKDHPPTESYMLDICKMTIKTYTAMPDLACLMQVKICKMLIAAISVFKDTEGIGAPWTRFFEGSQGLCWDLGSTPTLEILMGLYSQVQFMPSHFLLTFEEAFYTGFFEHAKDSLIFSPIITNYEARYIAFAKAEDKNPYNLQLESEDL